LHKPGEDGLVGLSVPVKASISRPNGGCGTTTIQVGGVSPHSLLPLRSVGLSVPATA
jgi:hypothetical protein